jgi:hypothetical protein
MSAVYNHQAEDEARAAMLRAWGIYPRPKKPDANVVSLDAKRAPLGLRPADGACDDDRAPAPDDIDTPGYWEARRIVEAVTARLSPETLARPVTFAESFQGLEIPLTALFDGADALFDHIKKLRAELVELWGARREEAAELRATIAELWSELSQMRSIQEASRVASRGEEGREGPRGIPGPIGPRGERGKAGEPGAPAREVVAWDIDVDRFAVIPVFSDGSRGVPINLRGLFETYDQQVNDRDDAEMAEAAAASRARLEAEVRAKDWANR